MLRKSRCESAVTGSCLLSHMPALSNKPVCLTAVQLDMPRMEWNHCSSPCLYWVTSQPSQQRSYHSLMMSHHEHHLVFTACHRGQTTYQFIVKCVVACYCRMSTLSHVNRKKRLCLVHYTTIDRSGRSKIWRGEVCPFSSPPRFPSHFLPFPSPPFPFLSIPYPFPPFLSAFEAALLLKCVCLKTVMFYKR